MSRNTPKSHRRLDHISTEDVRNCIAGTCDCWHRMSRELSALRLRVEELTHERDQALDILWHDIDDLRDHKLSLTQVASKAANGKYWSQVRKDWLQLRTEKAERELGEARQALRHARGFIASSPINNASDEALVRELLCEIGQALGGE